MRIDIGETQNTKHDEFSAIQSLIDRVLISVLDLIIRMTERCSIKWLNYNDRQYWHNTSRSSFFNRLMECQHHSFDEATGNTVSHTILYIYPLYHILYPHYILYHIYINDQKIDWFSGRSNSCSFLVGTSEQIWEFRLPSRPVQEPHPTNRPVMMVPLTLHIPKKYALDA